MNITTKIKIFEDFLNNNKIDTCYIYFAHFILKGISEIFIQNSFSLTILHTKQWAFIYIENSQLWWKFFLKNVRQICMPHDSLSHEHFCCKGPGSEGFRLVDHRSSAPVAWQEPWRYIKLFVDIGVLMSCHFCAMK